MTGGARCEMRAAMALGGDHRRRLAVRRSSCDLRTRHRHSHHEFSDLRTRHGHLEFMRVYTQIPTNRLDYGRRGPRPRRRLRSRGGGGSAPARARPLPPLPPPPPPPLSLSPSPRRPPCFRSSDLNQRKSEVLSSHERGGPPPAPPPPPHPPLPAPPPRPRGRGNKGRRILSSSLLFPSSSPL